MPNARIARLKQDRKPAYCLPRDFQVDKTFWTVHPALGLAGPVTRSCQARR